MAIYKLPKIINKDNKPPFGARINWHHPLSQGLVGAWLFNEGGGNRFFDILGMTNASLNSHYSWSAKGMATDSDDTILNRVVFDRKPYSSVGSGPFTVVSRVSPLSNTANKITCCGSFFGSGSAGNEFVLAINYATSAADYYPFFRVNIDGSGDVGIYQAVACPPNVPVTIAGQRDGTTIRLFRDGSQVSQGVCGSGNLHSGSYNFRLDGIELGATYNGYSRWEFIYIYLRLLSIEEIDSLHANPYQMFLPSVWDAYFVPAAAPPPTGGKSIFGYDSIFHAGGIIQT